MNKADLIADLSARLSIPRSTAAEFLECAADIITRGLIEDGKVGFVNFGSLKTTNRPARTGTSPSTGEPIAIQESIAVLFKPAPALRKKLNTSGVARKPSTRRPPAPSESVPKSVPSQPVVSPKIRSRVLG